MAKTNKRPKTKTAAKSQPEPAIIEAEEEKPSPQPAATEVRVRKAPKVSRSQVAAERIEEEYAYITKDLRRVFILAAVMFGLLIALNIVIGAMGG